MMADACPVSMIPILINCTLTPPLLFFNSIFDNPRVIFSFVFLVFLLLDYINNLQVINLVLSFDYEI